MMLFTRSSLALGLSRQRKPVRMSLLDDFTSKSSVNGLLGNALNRAVNTLNTKQEMESTIQSEERPKQMPQSGSSYSGNPCVRFTALAHLQWKYVLRPGVDAAIDATCGNGHDSCQLANMLFTNDDPGNSELVCIDIQEVACQNTRQALEEKLGAHLMEKHVRVLQTSHAPLPVISSPLALVCWNLGYLPNLDDKATYTQMESTVASIADAALQLRVGGLLSVMTYPNTNVNEDFAVHALFEALAVLSSKSVDWREYLDTLGQDPQPVGDDAFTVKKAITTAIHRVAAEGGNKQTWRAMEHKMMGRTLAPILLTSTRVK